MPSKAFNLAIKANPDWDKPKKKTKKRKKKVEEPVQEA